MFGTANETRRVNGWRVNEHRGVNGEVGCLKAKQEGREERGHRERSGAGYRQEGGVEVGKREFGGAEVLTWQRGYMNHGRGNSEPTKNLKPALFVLRNIL